MGFQIWRCHGVPEAGMVSPDKKSGIGVDKVGFIQVQSILQPKFQPHCIRCRREIANGCKWQVLILFIDFPACLGWWHQVAFIFFMKAQSPKASPDAWALPWAHPATREEVGMAGGNLGRWLGITLQPGPGLDPLEFWDWFNLAEWWTNIFS